MVPTIPHPLTDTRPTFSPRNTPGIAELTPKIIAFIEPGACLTDRAIFASFAKHLIINGWKFNGGHLMQCYVLCHVLDSETQSASNWRLSWLFSNMMQTGASAASKAQMSNLGLVLHSVNGLWFKSHFNFEIKKLFDLNQDRDPFAPSVQMSLFITKLWPNPDVHLFIHHTKSVRT